MQDQQVGDTVVIIVVLGALTIGLISILIGYLVAAWDRFRVWRKNRSVKPSETAAPVVMSRPQEAPPQNEPLSLRQTAPQTDRQVVAPSLPRDVMLDIYRLLRAHNVPREKARPILKAAGIPLDNNLWTEAAPPEDDTMLTPIAGRPTKASYYPDQPDLEFQPPPS